MSTLAIAIASAATATLGVGGYVLARTLFTNPADASGRTVPGGNVDDWIRSGRLRTPPTDLTGFRRVPIIANPRITPHYNAAALPPGNGPATYAALLEQLRDYAHGADVDVDMRVLWCLWTNETGARGDGCKEHNAGCTHGDALIWCIPAQARDGYCYTRHPFMKGVYIGRDGGMLPFSAWETHADFVKYIVGLFDSTYPEAAQALRRGGRESLDAFAHGLVNGRAGPYMALGGKLASVKAAEVAADYRRMWDTRAARAGANWTR